MGVVQRPIICLSACHQRYKPCVITLPWMESELFVIVLILQAATRDSPLANVGVCAFWRLRIWVLLLWL